MLLVLKYSKLLYVWETKCTVWFRSNHLFLFLLKKPKKNSEKKTITNKQFSICKNKIRDIISWEDHMNNLKGLNITTHPCTVQIWTGTVGRFYQCQLFKNSIREHQSHYEEDVQGAYFEPKKIIKEMICTFSVVTLQYLKDKISLLMKTWKNRPPSKVAHNRSNVVFFSTYSLLVYRASK